MRMKKSICSQGNKRVAMVPFLSLLVKKSAVSLTLFLIGFTVVGYLAFRRDISSQQQGTASISDEKKTPDQPSAAAVEAALEERDDSATIDSSRRNSTNFANQRGNLDLKGVYPVDLQNK